MAARSDIVDAVMASGGFVHGFTYAGNPLACSAGLAVLEVLQRANLVDRARVMGDRLKTELKGLMSHYEIIGDVRGKGLLLAFELVGDRTTMAPLPPQLNAHIELVEEAYRRGLIIYSRRTRGGTTGDHFMICPPLIVDEDQIAEIMGLLTESLDAMIRKLKLPPRSG
jgi:adenosylmethionine-8-amino-7-oxononanoate aminotransferase